ncbi:MAG: helix-turn-helix domain-containing protein, partial [Bacteroidota bacterium]|nr:helix-turn-helix domain-containing protein [Bacteroidota bacterium]
LYSTRGEVLNKGLAKMSSGKKEKPLKKVGAKKEDKIDTKEITYTFFKAGLSIEEIARERGFVVTTIEGHLAHYVEKGEIDVSKFISEEKLTSIINAIKKTETTKLNELIAYLGTGFTYSDLRFGMAHHLLRLQGKE